MNSSEIICQYCIHHCHLQDGQVGFCRARRNSHGQNVCANYGRITALALDPIEKKPFLRFFPGSEILSVGSYGCNLACPFCQNYTISMTDEDTAEYRTMTAGQLCDLALRIPGNLGLAFTYNEPLVSFEWILDCARLLKSAKKEAKIVLVTNGMIAESVLEQLMPFVDAMNIDLKGNRSFYKEELHGDYDMVTDTIRYVFNKCHLEVTTLIIPGKNDSDAFIEEQALMLSSLSPDIPWHLSRYFPRYHYTLPPTDVKKILHLQAKAQNYLHYVYTGNI